MGLHASPNRLRRLASLARFHRRPGPGPSPDFKLGPVAPAYGWKYKPDDHGGGEAAVAGVDEEREWG